MESQQTSTPDDELARSALQLESRPPGEILTWAVRQFAPRLAFGTGFGVEGCVLIDLIARLQLPIDVFTLDTGLLFPETRDLWRRLEARYGIAIRAVRPEQALAQQVAAYGPNLWERNPDLCCHLRKVLPLEAALSGFDAWISAIRRDQTRDRSHARIVARDPRSRRVKINPLASWSSETVWSHVRVYDVPFNPLHERGYASIGCWPCTSPVLPGEDSRAGRWRGRSKTECGLHARETTLPSLAASPVPPKG